MRHSDSDMDVFLRVNPNPCLVIRDGVIERTNAKFDEAFGYTSQHLADGLTWRSIVAPDSLLPDAPSPCEALADCAGGMNLPARIMTAGGEVVTAMIEVFQIDGDGRPACMVVVRSDTALSHGEEKYRELFDNMVEGIYQTTPDGRILDANPALVAMLGYDSKEELMAAGPVSSYYAREEDRQPMLRELEATGHLRNVEITLRRKDGSEIVALENARLVRDSGGRACFYEGILTDITDRKEALRSIQRERDTAQSYLDIAEVILVILNGRGEIVMINRKGAEVLEAEQDELVGVNWFDNCVPEEQAPRLKEVFAEVMANVTKNVEYFENDVRTASGKRRLIAWRNRALLDGDGEIVGTLSSGEDITERKRAEERLRTMSLVLQQSSEGISLVNMDGTVAFCNVAYARFHGYDPAEVMGKHLQIFHTPDQMDAVMDSKDDVMDTGTYRGEMWHATRDGTPFLSYMNNTLLRDDEGNPVGVIATMRDITEEKAAEERLRHAHEQLAATLDALPDLMFETDRRGIVLDYRAASPSLLYAKPEDFIGKSVSDVLPPAAAEVIHSALETARQTRRSRGEVYSLEIEGETRWFEISIAAKGDPKQPPERFVALVRDVTSRRRSEMALRQASDDLAAERTRMAEKNIALRHLLEQIEERKDDHRRQLQADLNDLLGPLLKRMRESADGKLAKAVQEVEDALRSVLVVDEEEYRQQFAGLTSRESELCDLVKAGQSTKQIAERLNLSEGTVRKHREHIREKLGLVGRKVSLATFLRSR